MPVCPILRIQVIIKYLLLWPIYISYKPMKGINQVMQGSGDQTMQYGNNCLLESMVVDVADGMIM